MTTFPEIRNRLKQSKDDLQNRYGVVSLGVFGSYVRGEQKPDSDVDILVEMEKPIGFFRFIELEEHLASILGVKVDLVTKKALKPAIGSEILREVIQI